MNKETLKILIINAITLLRLVGVFVLFPVFYKYGGIVTFIVCIICFLSDFVDGFLARKWKVSTFFGSIFDCVTDKLFLIINMILLLVLSPISIIPIILEVLIALTQYIKYYYKLTLKTSRPGKIKMWIAGITVPLCYLLMDISNEFVFAFLILILVLSEFVTLVFYIKELFKQKDKMNKNLVKKEEVKLGNVCLKELLFSPSIYKQYEKYGNIKLLLSLARKKIK